jgi:hypothetical protein
LQVFTPNILGVKNSLNLIVPNILRSIIANKHNRLNHQTTEEGVTGQALFATRESTSSLFRTKHGSKVVGD